MALTVGLILIMRGLAADGDPVSAMGGDSYSYWAAGVRIIDGGPLHRDDAIGQLGAYFYPPIFAQAWAPMVQPPLLADWAATLGVLSIRYMSCWWLWTGVLDAASPDVYDLTAGTVTFARCPHSGGIARPGVGHHPGSHREVQLARGRAVRMVQAAGRLLAGACWWRCDRRRGDGRARLSVPAQWADVTRRPSALRQRNPSTTRESRLLPTASATSCFGLPRGLHVIASIRLDLPHLAYIAAFLATPVMWQQRSVVLLALLTLEGSAAGWSPSLALATLFALIRFEPSSPVRPPTSRF